MHADNHSDSWSDADVRKYLRGELSTREMHDLERAALEDPFLADALEGLATASAPDADMGELRARLAARVDKKTDRVSAVWFRRPAFRVAASVILLAGIGITAWYTLFNHRNSGAPQATVAKRPAVPPATEPQPPAAPPATVPAANDVVMDKAAEEKKAAPVKRRPVSDDIRALPVGMDKEKSTAYLKRDARADSLQSDSSFTQGLVANKPPPVPNIAPAATATMFDRRMAPVTKPLSFSGRVVDNNNRPLAGAVLSLNKGYSNVGARTDNEGNFNFNIQPRDTVQTMTVAMNGYKRASFSLNSNALTGNVIQLQEAKPDLNEVVITGYGAKRRETLATAPSDISEERLDSAWIKVYPVTGKLAYEEYLDSARKALNLDPTIRGRESVSFQVDQKGHITSFKIEESLSPAHDAGLIQMISAGPAWKLLRGKKARAVVTLNFP